LGYVNYESMYVTQFLISIFQDKDMTHFLYGIVQGIQHQRKSYNYDGQEST